MKNVITVLIILVLVLSCKDRNSHKKSVYILEKSEKQLSFSLDNNTKSAIQSMFLYTDIKGKEFLTFQNPNQNEILFYDMNSERLEFKVKPDVEGPNGVGFFLGYYIHNLDSIFLTAIDTREIVLVNRIALVGDKIQYEKAEDGTQLMRFYSASVYFHPIIWIDNKMYITPGPNRWAEKNPVSAVIDMSTKSVHAHSFSYPSFSGATNKAKKFGVEEKLSRCFDGEHFVYSFHFDENIYIASIDHDSIRKVKVKSQFIDKVKMPNDYGNLTANDMCANPNYGNLIFDKYRKVYYRIAYPETEIEKEVKGLELMQYGRKKFSIIILDRNFNIIGETLFPDNTYNSMLMFIRRDGLYISDSHYLNPQFNEDVLSFRKFDLIEK